MRIDQDGIDFIHYWEKLRLTAYDDGTGVLTIGWGDTDPRPEPGETITAQEAADRFIGDIRRFEDMVNKVITAPITQCQFNALVSFVYNTGTTRATLFNLINSKADMDTIEDSWLQWSHAGGRVLKGLQRRRQAEFELFDGKPVATAIKIGTNTYP